MLRLSGIEFIARLIPESLMFVFATYAFSKNKINVKKYFKSVLMLIASVFVIRMLPISYGVHTILNIIALTVITIKVSGMDAIASIKSSIITCIILFALEAVNMGILAYMFTDSIDKIMLDPVLKTIYGVPSITCFALVVLVYYFNLKKKGKLKDV